MCSGKLVYLTGNLPVIVTGKLLVTVTSNLPVTITGKLPVRYTSLELVNVAGMTKKVTISLSDTQYQQLCKLAEAQGMTPTGFVKKLVLETLNKPQPKQSEDSIRSITSILEEINAKLRTVLKHSSDIKTMFELTQVVFAAVVLTMICRRDVTEREEYFTMLRRTILALLRMDSISHDIARLTERMLHMIRSLT